MPSIIRRSDHLRGCPRAAGKRKPTLAFGIGQITSKRPWSTGIDVINDANEQSGNRPGATTYPMQPNWQQFLVPRNKLLSNFRPLIRA